MEGNQFPSAYKDGAFIAFHGSWNRAPEPQGGYNVVFQPLADGKPSGPFVVFADGFAGAYRSPVERHTAQPDWRSGPMGRCISRTIRAVASGALPARAEINPPELRPRRHRVPRLERRPPPMFCRRRASIRTPARHRSLHRLGPHRIRSHWANAFSRDKPMAGPVRDVTAPTAKAQRWVPI